jgi:CelD/BcsL family acetyltransferase involved in cellulose biosynthesis
LAESESALEEVRADWDRLAVATARPYCAPAWQLGWWRHAAPAGAELRAVVVRDGVALIGIAPFFAERGRYRLLAAPVCARTAPLAEPGREGDVAAAVAGALAEARPRPAQIQLDGVEAGSPWPDLLAGAWDARAIELERATAPAIQLGSGSYEDWFGTRSRNFRQQMRRRRRALEEMGAEFALAGPHDLEERIGELERLHFERRGDRPSDAFGPGVAAMLADAGRELLDANRFRLWSVATPDATVSSQLFLEAGGELAFWNGGFDDAFRDQSPGVQAILAAVGDGIELGCERLELGAGDQDYKLRLTDQTDELVTVAIVPRGAAGLRARVGLARLRARRALAGAAPEGLKQRLRSMRGSGP